MSRDAEIASPVNLLAHLVIVVRVATAVFRAANFPVTTFFERRTRGCSSPSFRQIVAAACQSPDRLAASRTAALAFRFGDLSHDAHIAHLCIAIDDREDVRGKGRGCASDRSPEAIAGDTIEWFTSPVNRYDSFTSVYCGFGVGGIENCCLREGSDSVGRR